MNMVAPAAEAVMK
jgi:hypothetical protein